MQTSNKAALLANDGTFQSATRINFVKAAVNILGEPQGGMPQEEYLARQAYAKNVIAGRVNISQVIPSILSDSIIETAIAGVTEVTLDNLRDAVTDAMVNTRLGGVWSMLAVA